jgi:hypothetical protein
MTISGKLNELFRGRGPTLCKKPLPRKNHVQRNMKSLDVIGI